MQDIDEMKKKNSTLLPKWAPPEDKIRGKMVADFNLSSKSWFGVGGVCDLYFQPADVDDLVRFLQYLPIEIPIYPLGSASNLIIRSGGLRGVVIKLGSAIATIELQDNLLHVGAGALDQTVAKYAAKFGLAGCEFYAGIPGTIGGALMMNAGAHDNDTSSILQGARALDRQGKLYHFTNSDFSYGYRTSRLSDCGLIFISATFGLKKDQPSNIKARILDIEKARKQSQPIRSRTGGSTFKNPTFDSAWKIIDAHGLRGFKIGGAQISEKHCNFMINNGNATSEDLEMLGEHVRTQIYNKSGMMLDWEIRRVGFTKTTDDVLDSTIVKDMH